MKRKILSLKYLIRNLDTAIAILALICLITVTFIGVITRYIISSPFSWEEEVQLALIVWVVFLGGRHAFVTGSHPVIDMIVEKFPRRIQKPVSVLIAGVAILILFYVGYQGWKYVVQMYSSHRVSNIIHIPYALVYSALPAGCLLMSGQIAVNTWKEIRGKTSHAD